MNLIHEDLARAHMRARFGPDRERSQTAEVRRKRRAGRRRTLTIAGLAAWFDRG